MHNLDKVMASVVTRRRWWLFSSRYDGAGHAGRAAIFRKSLSMAVIYPAALFFFRVFMRSTESIRASLDVKSSQILDQLLKEVKAAISEMKEKSLLKPSDGT